MSLSMAVAALAAMLLSIFAIEGIAQQPTDEQRAIANAVAQERSAHLSSLSDRAVQLSAENAVLQQRLKEALAKACKPEKEPAK